MIKLSNLMLFVTCVPLKHRSSQLRAPPIRMRKNQPFGEPFLLHTRLCKQRLQTLEPLRNCCHRLGIVSPHPTMPVTLFVKVVERNEVGPIHVMKVSVDLRRDELTEDASIFRGHPSLFKGVDYSCQHACFSLMHVCVERRNIKNSRFAVVYGYDHSVAYMYTHIASVKLVHGPDARVFEYPIVSFFDIRSYDVTTLSHFPNKRRFQLWKINYRNSIQGHSSPSSKSFLPIISASFWADFIISS